MSATAIAVRLLLADEDLAAAVSNRVYPVVAPQEKSFPYIVAGLAYEDQDVVLEGQRDGYSSRIAIHCVAADAPAADRLGEAVKQALASIINQTVTDADGAPFAVATALKQGTDLIDFNEARTVFRRLIDYSIRWVPTS